MVWSLFFQKNSWSIWCHVKITSGMAKLRFWKLFFVPYSERWNDPWCSVFAGFEKDVNAFLSIFVIFFCLWYFFQWLNNAVQVVWPYLKVAFNIGLSPYLWNTWTNSNASKYWTTSWKNCGFPWSVNGFFCLVLQFCSLRHNLRLNEARRHNLIEWTRWIVCCSGMIWLVDVDFLAK